MKKCKNFLFDFLNELGNFKQKKFTLQNVNLFYILQQQIQNTIQNFTIRTVKILQRNVNQQSSLNHIPGNQKTDYLESMFAQQFTTTYSLLIIDMNAAVPKIFFFQILKGRFAKLIEKYSSKQNLKKIIIFLSHPSNPKKIFIACTT